MKRIAIAAMLSIALMAMMSPLEAAETKESGIARKAVTLFSEGKYKEMTGYFDSTMTKAAPPERLRAIWTSLAGQTGKFERIVGDSSFAYGNYRIVLVTCKFQKTLLDVKIVLDKSFKIAGLFFVPARQNQFEKSGNEAAKNNKSGEVSRKTGYISRDVTFPNRKGGVELAGTLTLPDSTRKLPAVLLVAGSGRNDRNETVAGHAVFKAIADYLASRGIAVLRYDKRGVGKSTGNYADATTEDFASDALAGVEYLAGLREIDHRKIGIIGHSEGGEVAPMVANESRSVAFVVLMAGPGVQGYRIILSQIAAIDRESGMSDSSVNANVALENRILKTVMSVKDSSRAAKELKVLLTGKAGETEVEADASIRELLSPWYRTFLSYDPRPALRKLRCPVLAIWGSKDLQVPPKENLPAVREALKSGSSGNYRVVEIPGLNHLFQEAKTGSPFEYGTIAEDISPKALDLIGDWIVKQTAK